MAPCTIASSTPVFQKESVVSVRLRRLLYSCSARGAMSAARARGSRVDLRATSAQTRLRRFGGARHAAAASTPAPLCLSRARLREADEGLEVLHGPVQDGEQQDGQRCEHNVEDSRGDRVHERLAAEAAVELVVEEDEGKGDVLVERVLDEAREAVVGQVAVHQQQRDQDPRGEGWGGAGAWCIHALCIRAQVCNPPRAPTLSATPT